MDYRSLQISFGVGVLASLVAGLLPTAGSWFVSQEWSVVALVGGSWIVVISGVALIVRQSYLKLRREYVATTEDGEGSNSHQTVRLVHQMSTEEAGNRIRSAAQEIWSLQISGSEFTANSSDTYEAWLSIDRNRHLLIAFADPTDGELLDNIVKLSGSAKETTHDQALRNLRIGIEMSLERYVGLRDKFGDRVDVRVYDFCPPYSIHAIDPDDDGNPGGSLFVELYLPDLPPSERPCMRLPHDHAAYFRYRTGSLAWFEAAQRA